MAIRSGRAGKDIWDHLEHNSILQGQAGGLQEPIARGTPHFFFFSSSFSSSFFSSSLSPPFPSSSPLPSLLILLCCRILKTEQCQNLSIPSHSPSVPLPANMVEWRKNRGDGRVERPDFLFHSNPTFAAPQLQVRENTGHQRRCI